MSQILRFFEGLKSVRSLYQLLLEHENEGSISTVCHIKVISIIQHMVISTSYYWEINLIGTMIHEKVENSVLEALKIFEFRLDVD